MTKMYQCSLCHTEFSDHDAYCENWKEPDKSFGCPKCKTMFRKIAPSHWRYKVAVTIYSSGALIPAVILGPDIIRKGDITTLLLLGMLVLSSTALFILYSKEVRRKYFTIERID